MPIATPEAYAEMLDRAKAGRFAYPAINVTSSQTLNAALQGFADAGSDGIVQVSTGGAEYLSGPGVKNMVNGAVALAEYAHVVAKQFDVQIALHTDHCPKDKLDGYMRPLIAISQERVDRGQEPLFQSHMWDGSAVELEREPEHRAGAAREVRQGPHRHGAGDRRRRRRGGRRRERDQREALHDGRGRAARPPRRSASARRAATCWPRPSATCTASTSRATSSSSPAILKEIQDAVGAKTGTTSRSTWSSTAARAACSRRSARRSTTAS